MYYTPVAIINLEVDELQDEEVEIRELVIILMATTDVQILRMRMAKSHVAQSVTRFFIGPTNAHIHTRPFRRNQLIILITLKV